MKSSGLGLSIAVLAFGASTIYLAVQLSEERARSEQLADASRSLNARIAELEKAHAAPQPVSGSFRAINMAPVMTGAPPPAIDEAQADALGDDAMIPPPGEAFKKMMRAQMRARNKQMYVDVGTQLGLTREEANKLIDLITDQQALSIPREVTDPAAIRRLVEEASRENKAKIAELLGPEKFQSFEEYQQSLPAWQEVDTLARQIDGSDATPLNNDQRKRLLAVLIEERKRVPSPQIPVGDDQGNFAKAYSEWQSDYNARVAAQARTILNAEQYAAYDDYLKWQKEMNEQMSSAHIQGAGNGDVMFTAVAPSLIVGETAVVTATESGARKEK